MYKHRVNVESKTVHCSLYQYICSLLYTDTVGHTVYCALRCNVTVEFTAMTVSHDDSIINIVLVLLFIYY